MIKITRKIFLVIIAVFLVNSVKSQCVINATATLNSVPFADTVKICLGQTVELQSQGTCAFLMNNDFNNQTLGIGWSSTLANPVFNNPCQCPFSGGQPPATCAGIPGQLGPNGAFAWVGTTASNERTLITQSYDLTQFIVTGGCKIKFWMMFGITPNPGGCEDPEGIDEGVHLQYSVNNGTTWTDFPGPHTNPVGNLSPTPPFNTITTGSGGYWAPSSSLAAQLQSTLYFWNRYKIDLPNNIYTNNTKFRWAQLQTDNAGYDAWGIDEVEIVCNAAQNTTVNWTTSSGSYVGNGFNLQVTPAQSDWYIVTIKDTSVTPAIFAYDSIYIQVFPVPTSNFTVVSPICSKYSSKITFTGTASNQAVYNWTFNGDIFATIGTGNGPYDITWSAPSVGADSSINIISLEVVDKNNCTSTITNLDVIVYKSPELSFTLTPANPAGCQPVDVSFQNESEPGNVTKTLLWNFGDGSTSSDINPSHTYTAAGVFNISLYLETLYGCKDSTTVSNAVASYPQPVAGFLVSPDLAPKNNAHFNFGNTSTNSTIYYWDFGDGLSSTLSDPTHDYFEAQEYTIWLYVNTIWGCKDSISKTVRVVEDSLVFPNIITPNGDGKNDYFDITNLNPQSYPTNTLVIYNRWGKKVYIKENYYPAVDKWDGNGLPEGTYYYILQYEGYIRKGEFKGSLTILR